jgi:hypothetical protein
MKNWEPPTLAARLARLLPVKVLPLPNALVWPARRLFRPALTTDLKRFSGVNPNETLGERGCPVDCQRIQRADRLSGFFESLSAWMGASPKRSFGRQQMRGL